MGEEEELSKRKKLPIIAPMMLGSTLPIPQYYFIDNNNYDDAVHKTFSSLLTVAHAGVGTTLSFPLCDDEGHHLWTDSRVREY